MSKHAETMAVLLAFTKKQWGWIVNGVNPQGENFVDDYPVIAALVAFADEQQPAED